MLCLQCGSDFTPEQKFCSSKCRTYYHRKNKPFSNNPVIKKVDISQSDVTVMSEPLSEPVTTLPSNIVKKKADKNGFCPHFIAIGGYCRSCNEN